MVIIKDMKIPDSTYLVLDNENEGIAEENNDHIIKNLSKINIFVGENNSGKSRLLRSLFFNPESRELEFRPDDNDFYKIKDNIENLKSKFDALLTNAIDNNVKTEIKSRLDNIEKKELLIEKGEYMVPINDLDQFCREYSLNNEGSNVAAGFIHNTTGGSSESTPITKERLAQCFKDIIDETFNLDKSIGEINFNYEFKNIYIPILRGLRPLNQDNIDLYVERTIKDYFKGNRDGFRLTFSGLDAYKTIRSHLLGNLQKRRLIEEFQEYLSLHFFDEKPVALIPQEAGDEILIVKIGDEIERPIFELGDGIQSIIIMTLPLFLYKEDIKENENILVFIEEPEHLLHPGLQRKLIDTFFNEAFDKFQFFITTHSNHFLDITLDYKEVSIFSLRKKLDDGEGEEKSSKFSIEPLSYGDTNALELLGVRNTSVFLSNCTIWVEGITDRYYIKKYFDVYQEYLKNVAEKEEIEFMEFREDYHYSFVEYAGNNITHWSFLDDDYEPDEEERINVDRVCGRIFLIADKDDESKPAKRERHEKLKSKLKERFYQLPCREIENLLIEDILLEVLKDYEIGEDEEERNNFSYNEFERSDYVNEPIGKFIAEVILKDFDKKRKYPADSGTLSSNIKTDFCKKAIDHIKEFKDASKDAINICNYLYQFIAFENSYDISNHLQICNKADIPYEIINFGEIEEVEDTPTSEGNLGSEETETA